MSQITTLPRTHHICSLAVVIPSDDIHLLTSSSSVRYTIRLHQYPIRPQYGLTQLTDDFLDLSEGERVLIKLRLRFCYGGCWGHRVLRSALPIQSVAVLTRCMSR